MIDRKTLSKVMSQLGRKGGQARSPAKTRAVRLNAGRRYCKGCQAEITSADREAGCCTQCQYPVRKPKQTKGVKVR
jgi:uncharacterized paraquat-inducible protein A